MPDVIGVNYYPHFTTARMTDGVVTPVRAGTAGLRDLVTLYSERYDRPIAVTETSLVGTVEDRMEWLHASPEELAELRAEGHEIIGYTWFPFFTMGRSEERRVGKECVRTC